MALNTILSFHPSDAFTFHQMSYIQNPYIGFGIGQNAPSIGGALPGGSGSPPQVLTVRFVQLNPSVLNCTITGHNAIPFMEVTTGPTPGGILRTILRRSNEGGFGYIDWGRYAFVEINNCVERKPINEWLPLSADRSRRIMNVQGRNFMWYNRDNSTYLDLDGAPSNLPNPPLARIFRIGEAITLELSTEAFQYNLQYAAIVATVLFHSGHFN
ncbi:hypothetical protein EST38_g288 [Candolleomyces aberdarensis]|uniref:Uncharacterized protein n=1 Tax=Candolleomyces aberdarensis TaxID=2316362 RepID=A0A4Q2DZS5_9AGAR|nr:hypothetical protein EST38_g288 [Candolleomyces aberdarensis]